MSITKWISGMAAVLMLAGALRADSIDEADAKKRGVPVQQIYLEREKDKNTALQAQLSRLMEENQKMHMQIREMQAKMDAIKTPEATAPQVAASQPLKSLDTPVPPMPGGSGPPASSPPPPVSVATPAVSSGSPKTVQVSGYTRKDGTYVAPYTRSAPKK